MRRKSLLGRKVVVKNGDPCGDVLLDEALKHIKVFYQQDWGGFKSQFFKLIQKRVPVVLMYRVVYSRKQMQLKTFRRGLNTYLVKRGIP